MLNTQTLKFVGAHSYSDIFALFLILLILETKCYISCILAKHFEKDPDP